jgi:hypothetical protein
MNVHFSSKSAEWSTPQPLFDSLKSEFRFTLDVCATAENAKCATFYTMADNGLAQPWAGTCWCNPPYGRQIGLWLAKAHESVASGATTVALIPSRTDTRWWHGIVMKASSLSARPAALRRVSASGAVSKCRRRLETGPMIELIILMGPLAIFARRFGGSADDG